MKQIFRDGNPTPRTQVGLYLDAKSKIEARLAEGANGMFGRFAKHFPSWNRAVR